MADTHCLSGWRVNFNVSVSTYEPSIKGVRNFIDFCLTSRKHPRLIYISTLGVLQRKFSPGTVVLVANWIVVFIIDWDKGGLAPEQPLQEPDSALGSGYTESKWVSERVVQKAASEKHLRATVVRCGQMTGGQNGAWNAHEWFPSLVKSSITFRAFPAVEGVSCSFLLAYRISDVWVECVMDFRIRCSRGNCRRA